MSSPIFIGGLMKSGTSLLRVLISKHPNIFGGLETHWFSPEIRTRWQDDTATRQLYLRQFYNVSADEFRRIKEDSVDGLDFFDKFMRFCTERTGKRRWVEKTPDNVLYTPLIRKQWPAAKFLHVIRDYRDVYASWKRNEKSDVGAFIEKARKICNSLQGFLGRQTDFYLEVDYQDLVFEPTPTMQAVLDHVGEGWVDGIDSNDEESSDFEKVRDVTGRESPTLLSLKKEIFTTSVGQWEHILTAEEVQRIETELQEYIRLWHFGVVRTS